MSVCPAPVSPLLRLLCCTYTFIHFYTGSLGVISLHCTACSALHSLGTTRRNDRLLVQWTMSDVQCSATNSIGSNTVSVLKELEAEHFFALNLQSSISAISQTLPPLSLLSDPLCNVQSPKHIGFACCVYCRECCSLTGHYFPGWRILVRGLHTVEGEDGTVTKGRTSIRDREQQAQRELESFVLEKSVDWHNVC